MLPQNKCKNLTSLCFNCSWLNLACKKIKSVIDDTYLKSTVPYMDKVMCVAIFLNYKPRRKNFFMKNFVINFEELDETRAIRACLTQ